MLPSLPRARRIALVAAAVVSSRIATAQVVAPETPRPRPTLSFEDQRLLERGEISYSRHYQGTVASVFLGFGIGQLIEGRWTESGWIFTLGESASLLAISMAYVEGHRDCGQYGCNGNPWITGYLGLVGLIGLAAFRGCGIRDAHLGPHRHNERVRELRRRLGQPPGQYAPYVRSTRDGGGVAGISVSF
jgi:hypothetical protein